MSAVATCRHCGAVFTGRLEHCSECCQTFAATGPGDSHRIGPYEPAGQRRCRTPEEMLAGGMWQDERGRWHGEWNKKGKQDRWTGPVSVTET